MKAYQIYGIFVALCLIELCSARYTPNLFALEEQIRNGTSPQKKVLVYAFDQLTLLGREYIASSVEISRNILKDEDLAANDKPEVEIFKNNLKNFVAKYDNSTKDVQEIWNLIEIYGNIWQKYFKITEEEEKTPEEKFILVILKKYGCENNNMEFVKKFHLFADGFIVKFEETREDMDKLSLEWLEHFKKLTKFVDRFGAVMEYVITMG